jgi:hypothetical protein
LTHKKTKKNLNLTQKNYLQASSMFFKIILEREITIIELTSPEQTH